MDRPGERDQGQAPRPQRRQQRGRLGQRDRRDVPPHDRRRQDLAGRPVPGASALDFRDVHAVDDETAYLLSIGAGDQSRIYKTNDGGATWATLYMNKDPKGFLDAIAFWDADHGLALGDPVDGRFVILTTDDGGKTWEPIPPDGMPLALPGEGAFAASGTCLVVRGTGTPGSARAGRRSSRVFRSTDRGRTWTAHETPVMAGTPSSGIFSLAFRDADHGVAVGGDYKEPGRAANVVALTSDGGRTWRLPKGEGRAATVRPSLSCRARRGGPWWPSAPRGRTSRWTAARTGGRLGTTGFHAVGFAGPSAGWAVGDDGLVARFGGAWNEHGTGKAREDRP